jgi:hypothetical protein
MSWKLGSTVLVLVAALGCSACGGTQHNRVTTSGSRDASVRKAQKQPKPLTLPAAANLVILAPANGTGNAQFGTFTASGPVHFKFSCEGDGPLTIVGILEHISPCDGSPTGASVPYHAGEKVHLTVRAKRGTTWRLAVGDTFPAPRSFSWTNRGSAATRSAHSSWAGRSRSSLRAKAQGISPSASTRRRRTDPRT